MVIYVQLQPRPSDVSSFHLRIDTYQYIFCRISTLFIIWLNLWKCYYWVILERRFMFGFGGYHARVLFQHSHTRYIDSNCVTRNNFDCIATRYSSRKKPVFLRTERAPERITSRQDALHRPLSRRLVMVTRWDLGQFMDWNDRQFKS